MAQQSRVRIVSEAKLGESLPVFRNNQEMSFGYSVDVSESKAFVIFVNNRSWDFFGHDLVEDCDFLGLGRLRKCLLIDKAFSSGHFRDEAPQVCHLLNKLFSWHPCAMACVNINSREQRALVGDVSLTSGVLELSHILECMKRNNSVIMISCCNEHSWIFLFFDRVQWRILEEVINSTLIGVSEIRTPEVSDRELLESEHICNWHLTDHACKQLRPLVGASCCQGSSIRPAVDDQGFVVCQFFIGEVFCSCNEIIKDILFLFFGSSFMPFFPVLATAS